MTQASSNTPPREQHPVPGKIGAALGEIIGSYRDGRTKACARALVKVVEIVDQLEAENEARAPQLSPFQGRVAPFMEQCFGPEISADTVERYHRFIEESLELAQSLGCSAQDAHMLVDYVFGRPIGQPHQEAGGVMVTLAALCLAGGLDMHAAGEDELRRVWGMIEVIREKQKKKPRGSPLPAALRSEITFSKREAENIVNSADAQYFRWLLKHHSGTQNGRCFIGGVDFQGEDVRDAIDRAIEAEQAEEAAKHG